MHIRKKVLVNLLIQFALFWVSFFVLLQGGRHVLLVQFLFLASSGVVLIYAVRHVPIPSFYHLFIASYLALFSIYPVASPLLGVSLPAGPLLNLYLFLTVGGLHLFTISYELTRTREAASSVYVIRFGRMEKMVWLLFAVNGLACLLIFIDAGSLEAIADVGDYRRVDRKLDSGVLSLLGLYLLTFAAVVYALLPAYVGQRKHLLIPIVGLCALIDLFIFLAFRNRTTLLVHLVALGVGYLYLKPRFHFNQIKPVRFKHLKPKLMRLIGVGLVLVAVGTYTRSFRGLMESTGSIWTTKVALGSTLEIALLNGDLGYTPIVFEVLTIVPEQEPFLNGQSYYRLLFSFIPRFIWQDKPPSTERIVAGWIQPNKLEYTLPPGFQGDLFINFGLWGILGFLVYGIGFARLERMKGLIRFLMIATSFPVLFHLARGGFTNPILLFATLFIGCFLVMKYIQLREVSYGR